MGNRAVHDPDSRFIGTTDGLTVTPPKTEPIYIIHRQLLDPTADLPVDDQPLYGVGFFTNKEDAGTEANRLTALEPYDSVNFVPVEVLPA